MDDKDEQSENQKNTDTENDEFDDGDVSKKTFEEQYDDLLDPIAFDKALQYMADGQANLAVDIFEEMYPDEQTYLVHFYFAKALFLDKQYARAAEMLLEDSYFYQNHFERFKLLIDALLLNHQFILARQMIYQGQFDQQTLLDEVVVHEVADRQNMQQTLRTIQRHFYQMSGLSIPEQSGAYDAAYRLPVEEFVQTAKALLVDPFVDGIVVSQLLTDLSKLEIDESLTYRWIDGEIYSINVKQLIDYQATSAYVALVSELERRLKDDDWTSFIAIRDELNLMILLLYPRLEVISDSAAWIDRMIDRYYHRERSRKPSQQDHWFDLVAEILIQYEG